MNGEGALFVTRRQTGLVWNDPDLQEMNGFGWRRVVFAVADSGPRAHALDIADPDDRASPRAVLVRQRTVEHVGNDFHVAVGVRWKSATRSHSVLVDDS